MRKRAELYGQEKRCNPAVSCCCTTSYYVFDSYSNNNLSFLLMKTTFTAHRKPIGMATLISLMSLLLLTFCGQQTEVQDTQTQNTSQAGSNALTPGVTMFAVEPAPVLGVVVDQNMQIIFIEPESAAERAGFKIGDTLVRVNSIRVDKPRNARETFYAQNFSKKIRITILRNGEEKNIEILPEARIIQTGAPTPTPVPPDMTYF